MLFHCCQGIEEILKIPWRAYYDILMGFVCSPYALFLVRWIVHFNKSIFNLGRIIYHVCYLVVKFLFLKNLDSSNYNRHLKTVLIVAVNRYDVLIRKKEKIVQVVKDK